MDISTAFAVLNVLIIGYVISVVILIVLENRNPDKTLAWLLVFLFLPFVGLVIYFLVGQNWKKKRFMNRFKSHRLAVFHEKIKGILSQRHNASLEDSDESSVYDFLQATVKKSSGFEVTCGNRIRLFTSADSKFEQLNSDLRLAQRFIHLEYFILLDGKVASSIKEILVKKARAGVEVRVLYDYFGSFKLSKGYIRELKEAGIQVTDFFNPLGILAHHRINYRNHRKIIVIDGRIAYIGGMNIEDKYIDGGTRFESWHDIHCRIEGEAVLELEAVFLYDWCIATTTALTREEYFPVPVSYKENCTIQAVYSGPESEWEPLKQVFFTMISRAKHSILLMSPYFIPDESLYQALKNAALSGVEVKIMFPLIPDKRLVYYASLSYFEDLLKVGVRVYQYSKGFMHAKMLAIDSEAATIGSTNFDLRSMYHNFESNIIIYTKKTVRELEMYFERTLADSKRLDYEQFRQRNVLCKLRDSFSRLLSSVL